ncbi:MAG: DUF4422 domain-containing protein [Muribaculaceae bacterium]|nr:DUF4422 domain-containing protein [Muribaculaceae bacterium]
MSKDITMLVCAHKQDYYRTGQGYLPVQVGKAVSPVDLHITGDDTGDNISEKNPNFCELTAHYWYWKNGVRTPYVGLSHYRRYLEFNKSLRYGLTFISRTPEADKALDTSLPDNVDTLFENYDIVLPKPRIYPYNLRTDYCYCHIAEDFDILRRAVANVSPDYLEAFDQVVFGQNKLSPCNMFLTTYKVFDDYSEWLFAVLFEAEKHCKISPYQAQARIFGYMSERLLNVYCFKNRLRVKYVPIVKIEEKSMPEETTLGAMRRQLCFNILKLGHKTI